MSDDPRISNLEKPTENPHIWGPGYWIAIHQWQLEEQAKDMEKAKGKSQDIEKSKT